MLSFGLLETRLYDQAEKVAMEVRFEISSLLRQRCCSCASLVAEVIRSRMVSLSSSWAARPSASECVIHDRAVTRHRRSLKERLGNITDQRSGSTAPEGLRVAAVLVLTWHSCAGPHLDSG